MYERIFKTAEYYCVNPEDWSVLGWRLNPQRYDRLQPNAQGWLWSDTLQLWLGFQEGHFQGTTAMWLRFFTPAGILVPTGEENAAAARERAETERARAEAAEAENARLRTELARLQR